MTKDNKREEQVNEIITGIIENIGNQMLFPPESDIYEHNKYYAGAKNRISIVLDQARNQLIEEIGEMVSDFIKEKENDWDIHQLADLCGLANKISKPKAKEE